MYKSILSMSLKFFALVSLIALAAASMSVFFFNSQFPGVDGVNFLIIILSALVVVPHALGLTTYTLESSSPNIRMAAWAFRIMCLMAFGSTAITFFGHIEMNDQVYLFLSAFLVIYSLATLLGIVGIRSNNSKKGLEVSC